MFDFLDKLRKKPIHVRMQIAYGTTGVLFFLIFTVWWNSWTIKDSSESREIQNTNTPLSVVAGTLTDLKDSTLTSWEDTVASIQGIASSSEIAAVVESVNSDAQLTEEASNDIPIDPVPDITITSQELFSPSTAELTQ